MLVGVYASARNEEKNLAAWLDSTAGADVVVVNDSGSTDDTVERFRALGVDVHQEPAADTAADRFNLALSLLPDDIDLCIRLDLDERLQPGWRETLDNIAVNGPTVLQPWFDHQGVTYRHDRIHTRHGFRWELPIHEVLVYDGPYQRLPVELTIEHHQDMTKDRTSTVPLLERALAQDPTNLRLLHYLGREYTYYARWSDALPLLRKHGESDAWAAERAESWVLVGDGETALGENPTRSYKRATDICPTRREPWVKLAEALNQHGRHHEARTAAERALQITERSDYFNHAYAWNEKPHDEAALACHYLGLVDAARWHGERALEFAPQDARLQTNMEWYAA